MGEFENTLAVVRGCIDCGSCTKTCVMLKKYGPWPKSIFIHLFHEVNISFEKEEMRESSTPVSLEKQMRYSESPYMCTQCGLCNLKCPYQLPIREAFMEWRSYFSKINQGKAPLKGHRNVHWHQFLNFRKPWTRIDRAGRGQEENYGFMPGCSLLGEAPDLVKRTYKLLRRHVKEMVYVQFCCANPTRVLGEKERFNKRHHLFERYLVDNHITTLVTACPNCLATMTQRPFRHPIKVISLWEFMIEKEIPIFGPDKKETKEVEMSKEPKEAQKTKMQVTIHDACATRHEEYMQACVRKLIEKAGYEIVESVNHGENTMCCGSGGMVYAADPRMGRAFAKQRKNTLENLPTIVYCATCRRRLSQAGIPAVHILEVVHGDWMQEETGEDTTKNFPQHMPTWKTWWNRYHIKSCIEGDKSQERS